MNYKIVAVFAVLLQISACALVAQDNKHIASKELTREVKQAQTADELQAAAKVYRSEALLFRNDAQLENIELARRIEQAGGRTLKYPSPVDSARYLYAYYVAQANAMKSKAQEIDTLAASKR